MTLSRRHFTTLLAGMGLAGTGWPLAASAGSADAVSADFVVQLDWRFNAQFAGVLVAAGRGLYQQAGLAVTVRPIQSGMDVPTTVAILPNGIGCSEQALLLQAQVAGLPLVAVAAQLQQSPLALMSLPDTPLTGLQDLQGKRVGVHADGLQALQQVLRQVPRRNGDRLQVTIEEIPSVDKQARLQSGEFDAVQCYAIDEPIAFARDTGVWPVLLRFADYGFEAYSEVLFTSQAVLDQSPAALVQFLRCTMQGWQWALDRPQAAAQLIATHYAVADTVYADPDYEQQILTRLVPYLVGMTPLGHLSRDRWRRMAQQWVDQGVIDRVPAIATTVQTLLTEKPVAKKSSLGV